MDRREGRKERRTNWLRGRSGRAEYREESRGVGQDGRSELSQVKLIECILSSPAGHATPPQPGDASTSSWTSTREQSDESPLGKAKLVRVLRIEGDCAGASEGSESQGRAESRSSSSPSMWGVTLAQRTEDMRAE